MKICSFFLTLFVALASSCSSQNSKEDMKTKDSEVVKEDVFKTIEPQETAKYPKVKSIPVPKDYKRVEAEVGSFGSYLRNLELKTENNMVYLYNGQLKHDQSAQFAVIKIDVGTRDLQQCADAVMRLRGEYLFEQKQYSNIHFNFLSDGKPRYFKTYANGNYSHKTFRKYMDYIFSYANTASLKKELKKVDSAENIQVGDVFIQRGNPYGHAVTVMDLAKNDSGELVFMLSQSYMPAQDIHILKNPLDKNLSPWYKLKTSGKLTTPQWEFDFGDLRRF